jgi:hypothetical protein
MKKLAIFVVGSVISYLLWFSYFGLIPPKLLTAAVANEYSQKAIAILGNHMARESAVLVAFVIIRALPGAVILGALVGGALHFVGKRLLLCLSILTWPLFICGRYFMAFYEFGFGSTDYQGYFKAEMSTALAFYSLFFLVVLGVYALGKLVTHNPAVHTDAAR